MTTSVKTPVQITLYGSTDLFESQEKAQAFLMDCIVNSEGSEQSRYCHVLGQLLDGQLVCTDEDY